MEIGELTDVVVVKSREHNEKTCPWPHDKKSSGAGAEPMAKQDLDEDASPALPSSIASTRDTFSQSQKPKPMPKNSGGALGNKLGECTGKDVIQVTDPATGNVKEEDLQWAAHHLVPGNESLKGSDVVPYLGATTVIKSYSVGQGSRIRDGKTVGYDVNDAKNGVWLPSPYALSMSGNWPKGDSDREAYVIAALDQSNYEKGGKRFSPQFHMKHDIYSDAVRKNLQAIGARLAVLAKECPEAKDKESSSKKLEPPTELKERLFELAERLRTLVTGGLWVKPFLTDNKLVAKYAEARRFKVLSKTKTPAAVDKVAPKVKL